MKNTPDSTFEKSLMQDLCRYIEAHSDEGLTLEQLAKQAHLSPTHLQRRFKAAIGVSPKEYADACRLKKLKTGLRHNTGASVTHAIYDAGFASSSRVYERIDSRLGMTPKQYRARGKGVIISYAISKTPLGHVLMGATDRGLCFIQFGDDKKELTAQLGAEYSQATLQPMGKTHREQFSAWMQALSDYLHGHAATLDLPLDIRGTAFQLKVWKYLQTIPPGSVASYTEVAHAIGSPKAVRAVASACAKNRVAIAIPCHRVIRGNGDLAGYRWGLERKRALLGLEARSKVRMGP
jgi:AraC family transcriptional regulator of adaptative response/methylated-DNA-[protein]-cysteine methyltransferase